MNTTMKFFPLFMVLLVAFGIVLITVTMKPDIAQALGFGVGNNCYDALNAAGQVVQTICH